VAVRNLSGGPFLRAGTRDPAEGSPPTSRGELWCSGVLFQSFGVALRADRLPKTGVVVLVPRRDLLPWDSWLRWQLTWTDMGVLESA
jgi:hypothetical protein